MKSKGGRAPSEAAYCISVLLDMLKSLELLLQQLRELESQRHDEIRITLEKRMEEVLKERLPKIIQQLWDEICEAFASAASSHGVNCAAREELWDELAHQCVQFPFFRSIYEYAVAALSGRTLAAKSHMVTNYHCIERLLKERENMWASAEWQITSEWLKGFIKHLLLAAAYREESEGVHLGHLEKSVALVKETFQEFNSQGKQKYTRGVDALTSGGVSDGDAFELERIRREYLKFFREACIGVAGDLLSLVRQKDFLQSPSSGNCHVEMEKNTSEGEEKMGAAAVSDSDADAGILSSPPLIAGEDRWVFFRVHPNDSPTLTVNEVACQVFAFYEIHNTAKSPMAAVLAEGYGDDYAELFDALECRYFIPKRSDASVRPEVAIEVSENLPDERRFHFHGEPAVRTAIESDTRDSGCFVM
ncbi:hypothetical protein MOQ_001970 [Trypanosoma cruzi marinkellei]|uniref:Uncharacterized protein n=1 Tax=Trypanosoma cruzi marinkellei TaxID=85056 RepID=K2P9Q7_TRYCR|nr:hypothetical protein MOQ_001970 [Trypanosoma cruzi marinkellei]